jgi:hypothetical protein
VPVELQSDLREHCQWNAVADELAQYADGRKVIIRPRTRIDRRRPCGQHRIDGWELTISIDHADVITVAVSDREDDRPEMDWSNYRDVAFQIWKCIASALAEKAA